MKMVNEQECVIRKLHKQMCRQSFCDNQNENDTIDTTKQETYVIHRGQWSLEQLLYLPQLTK